MNLTIVTFRRNWKTVDLRWKWWAYLNRPSQSNPRRKCRLAVHQSKRTSVIVTFYRKMDLSLPNISRGTTRCKNEFLVPFFTHLTLKRLYHGFNSLKVLLQSQIQTSKTIKWWQGQKLLSWILNWFPRLYHRQQMKWRLLKPIGRAVTSKIIALKNKLRLRLSRVISISTNWQIKNKMRASHKFKQFNNLVGLRVNRLLDRLATIITIMYLLEIEVCVAIKLTKNDFLHT
jgi:hypothetical protein